MREVINDGIGQFSSRVAQLEPSATMAVSSKANRLRSEGVDVINVSSGRPDFDTPQYIKSAANKALEDGKTKTTDPEGIEELREAVVTKLQQENNITTDSDRVVATPGTKYALFQSLFSLLQEGDEAVVLDPSWVSYESMITMSGGSVNRVKLKPDTGFTLEGSDIKNSVGDNTRVLILNTPANPSGAVFSKKNLKMIRDLAVDHDFWVLSDEIYEKIVYHGAQHHSIGALDGMDDRCVTVNGFSKSHSMTGWRLGYLNAPKELVNNIKNIQSNTVSCPTSFVQHAGVTALTESKGHVEKMRDKYESRMDTLLDTLADIGVEIPEPKGAYYAFVPVKTDDDIELCQQLLEEKQVAAVPGTPFGVSGYIRLSCTNQEERLIKGVRRISNHLGH
jgi:aspartate aminotransferase